MRFDQSATGQIGLNHAPRTERNASSGAVRQIRTALSEETARPVSSSFCLTVPSLVQKIFNVTERKRKPNIKHHSQADDLWARFKVPEWSAFCHTARLRNRPPRLKLVLSDSAYLFII